MVFFICLLFGYYLYTPVTSWKYHQAAHWDRNWHRHWLFSKAANGGECIFFTKLLLNIFSLSKNEMPNLTHCYLLCCFNSLPAKKPHKTDSVLLLCEIRLRTRLWVLWVNYISGADFPLSPSTQIIYWLKKVPLLIKACMQMTIEWPISKEYIIFYHNNWCLNV